MIILSEKILNELKFERLRNISLVIFLIAIVCVATVFVTDLYVYVPDIITKIILVILLVSFELMGIFSIIEQPSDIKQYDVYVNNISEWEDLQRDYVIVDVYKNDIHRGIIQDKEPPN